MTPVGDGDVFVRVVGAGPPLVCLHGWTFDGRIWSPQIDTLARSHTLIVPDRRGFGRSTAPPSLDRELDDLRAIQDALGVQRFALMGMSQGGRVALRFAAAQPETLSALVLLGAPLDGLAPDPAAPEPIPVGEYAALVRAGRIEAMRAHWLAHPLLEADTPEAAALLRDIVGAYEARDLLTPAAARADWPALALDALSMPTLVVTGERDAPARRRAGAAIAAAAPHATRWEIPKGGHVCNVTHPDAFNSVVTRFLERVGA